jgi:dTDP-4-dehydrorhamnose reductase
VSGPPVLLVVGLSGYLGCYLAARAERRWRTVGTYLTRRPSADLDARRLEVRDSAAVEALLAEVRPRAVLHLAYRPTEPEITVQGTRNLAAACTRWGARLVLVSTDLVFDGQRGWYREDDPPSPLEAYGASKMVAEREVLERGGAVARTSLIYGFEPLDPITDKLVVGPLVRGEVARLFVDEYRCPSYAPDLAAALLELAAQPYQGLLHLAGPQRLNRLEFGRRLAEALGLDPAGLTPGTIAESGLRRPPDVSLDTSLARRLLRSRIRSVDQAVALRRWARRIGRQD